MTNEQAKLTERECICGHAQLSHYFGDNMNIGTPCGVAGCPCRKYAPIASLASSTGGELELRLKKSVTFTESEAALFDVGAEVQRDADQKVVDELEHKLNMSKIEVKGLELTVKALEAKLPTKEEAEEIEIAIVNSDNPPSVDTINIILAKLRAIVEGA